MRIKVIKPKKDAAPKRLRILRSKTSCGMKSTKEMHFFKSILLRIICPVGLSETTVASSSITSKGHTKLSSRQKSGKSFS